MTRRRLNQHKPLEGMVPADRLCPSTKQAWWLVLVLIALSCVSLIDRQIISLLVPQIREELSLSDFQLGLLQGLAFAGFYVTFGLLFGWLVDRTSRRGVAFVGVTIWGLATGACGLASNATQLALARFGVGAGESALNPAAYSMMSDAFPRERLSFALSVFSTGAHLGVGLSLLAGGYLIAVVPVDGLILPMLGHLTAWRVVFLAAGVPALLLSLMIWTTIDPPRRGRLREVGVSRSNVAKFMRARWRFYTGHFTGFALISAAGYGYNGWAPVFLMRRFDMDVTQVVQVLAPVSVIGGAGGTLLAGTIADLLFRSGINDAHLRVFIFGAMLQAAFLVLAASSTSWTWFALWGGLTSACLGYVGVAPAALQLVTPNELRGQVSAAYQFAAMLAGAGVGTAVVGALTTYLFRDDAMVGWAIAINALIACPLAALALLSALGPMRQAITEAAGWSAEPS